LGRRLPCGFPISRSSLLEERVSGESFTTNTTSRQLEQRDLKALPICGDQCSISKPFEKLTLILAREALYLTRNFTMRSLAHQICAFRDFLGGRFHLVPQLCSTHLRLGIQIEASGELDEFALRGATAGLGSHRNSRPRTEHAENMLVARDPPKLFQHFTNDPPIALRNTRDAEK